MIKNEAFILLLILTIGVITFVVTNESKEGFQNNTTTTELISPSYLHAYVISLRHENRMKNIEEQKGKIKPIDKTLVIFDAVKGDKLDLSKLDNLHGGHYETVPEDYWKRRTVACYMSHMNLMKKIQKDGFAGYSIVFEDDFKITTSHFYTDVSKIINTCNMNQYAFDLIILGNTNSNRGQHLINNIYLLDKSKVFYGAHGYIVNNASINKIIDAIKTIDYEIDVKYSLLAKEGKLNILIIFPYLVVQQPDKMPSTILDTSIETFQNYSELEK